MHTAATILRALFDAAVAAAAPARCVPAHLPSPPRGRTVVVGAGKAAAAMARAVEAAWPGELSGIVVTRYGHAEQCERIEVVEAGHPVPDAAGRAAAERVLAAVVGLGPDDLVLCLLSGGGSALLALPQPWLTLADKQRITGALLRSGASIAEINCVRKHLSAIKGGQLARAAHPAAVHTLAISDVPGDDPAVIASGPTVPDPSTAKQACAVLRRHGVDVPPGVLARLAAHETPEPGDPRVANARYRVVACATGALDAAAELARRHGAHVVRLGDHLEGRARDVAAEHAVRARGIAWGAEPCPRPCALLSGGETTVAVRGGGRGGRNTELALALAIALDGHPGVHALAADTDGIDGVGDNAGARVAPDTLPRAAALGLDPARLLADNDAYAFFEPLGDLVTTGPTRTNVNDFRAIWIEADATGGGDPTGGGVG